MIIIDVTKNDATVVETEKLTSGTKGLKCQFNFSEEWENLDKIAVCSCGNVTKDVVVESNVIEVPWEVMAVYGKYLEIGVYGSGSNGTVVIPTIYATVGAVCKGADPSGDESFEPTPSIWEKIFNFFKNVPYTVDEEGNATFNGNSLTATADEQGNLIHEHYCSKEYLEEKIKNQPNVDISSLSNTLEGSAKSENTLEITDTSPIEHNMGLKVESKNLLPPKTVNTTIKGITFTSNTDGTISVKGTATGDATLTLYNQNLWLEKGTYTLSGCPAGGGHNTTYWLEIRSSNTGVVADVGKGKTLKLTKSQNVGVYIYVMKGKTVDLVFKPMIECGTVATTHTPPVDLSKVIITREEDGKVFAFDKDGNITDRSGNILTTMYNDFVIENSGVVSTSEGGNTVKIDTLETGAEGVAHLSITNPIPLKAGTTYYFKVEGKEPPRDEYGTPLLTFDVRLNGELSKGTGLNINEETEYTPSEDGDADIFIMVEEGAICNDSVYTLSCIAKGDTIVNSLYPNNTFISNEEGVIISVDYNRDINKAIVELKALILELKTN
jgi:hypothetical protein